MVVTADTNARARYHHGDLQKGLIEASIALIEEQGAEGFTLREVARRAGVSHTAPYRHFADKQALLAAVAQDGFENLAEKMRTAAARSREPLGKMKKSGVAYVEFALEHAAHFRVMFGTVLDRNVYPESIADETFAEQMALIEACQEAGVITKGQSARQLARVLWALIHGIAELAASGQYSLPSHAAVNRLAGSAIDSLLGGIATTK